MAAHPRHLHRNRRGPATLALGGQLRHPRRRRPRPARVRVTSSGTRHPWRAVHRLPAGPRRRAGRTADPCAGPRRRPLGHGREPQRRPVRGLHRLPRPRRPGRTAPAHRGARPRHARRRRRVPAAGHRRRDRTGSPRHHRPALGPPALRARARRSMPAVHEDLAAVPGAVPILGGSGMRSVVTVPLKVEGRLTGSLGVAAESAGRYSNEEALRLQFAADRIALAVESARLGELERLRRGSLSFLVEASDLLAGTLDRDQTLALMAQMTVPTLATWCAVYTIADQASEPYLSYVLHEDEERIDGLKALLSKIDPPEPVPTPGARVWTAPGEAAHQAALRTSMRDLGRGSSPHLGSGLGTTLSTAAAVGGETVVLPLVARNRVIGMLTLGKPSDDHFRQEILELAEDLSRRAALALDNARLYSERMAISRSLQRSLLPPGLPQIPGVEVEVIYRAAGEGNEVGGDFYDLFPIRDGAYGFAIGDVCGTGPEAAAVTGLARHALRLLAREGFGGPAVLERLNAAILDEGARSRFLTLLYGELWPQEDGSALLKVVCAGHPLPLRLRQDGTVEPAAEPQPLLGVMEDLELYEQTITLDPGDVLLCVTDGITERREGTRMLGDDGLTDVLATCTGLTAGAVAARVLRAVERFAAEPASDDMAILSMRIPEQPRH
ncbi:SpoIIE family protein phosphatase [Streptomyces sp. ERV7]|uniref:SpoIIE family protein phosphatase n=1 Tax=Streptomyces sp. ERV7 TaxID=1322334 RepID=UPI002D21E30D|nr:SpoIIE family protein phosphatase [Streptomyces sp. ERV7]